MEIACLGPSGTFTEEAAYKYCNDAVTIKCQTFEECVAMVNSQRVKEAIIPIENSIEGTVNAVMDILVFDANVYIKAEINLPVSQNIMVKGNIGQEKIEKIYSHPHALPQCRKYLSMNYPNASLVSVSSTAEAASFVSENGGNIAAIATELAASIYGLRIIEKNIQDHKENITTFVVVSKEDTSVPLLGNKTSIAFSTRNKPGELYKILDIFAIWDINITKIISRPMKNKVGEYIFFIDLDGFKDPKDVVDALTMVKRKTSFFKLLGSYKVI